MQTSAMMQMLSEHFVFVLIGSCFIISVVVSAATKIITTMTRERSRREIAAYVAEGSITPEHGERLIRAEVSQGSPRT